MTRRRKRWITLIVIFLLLLLCLGVMYVNYRATRQFNLGLPGSNAAALLPPAYLYSFSGTEAESLLRPIGVYVDDEIVYVTDARLGKIFRFTREGEFIDTFGEDVFAIPLYIAKNPVDGNLYISDRRTRSIQICDLEGNHLGEFDPNLPEDQLPTIDTERQWAPVALAFAPDGRLYVTEILRGHRLLIFDPSGDFQRSVGNLGVVTRATDSPERFQFPNGIQVHGDEVWIADSNNRRMQVFDLDGEFQRIVSTEGLPRGFDFLRPPASGNETIPPRFVVVDVLSHDATIWEAESGEKLLIFGSNGVMEGQFSYPNDVSVGPENRMFITDTTNARVQVWGWPLDLTPIPLPRLPQRWGWCLAPALLLPLLLFARKKRFFATLDFTESMLMAEVARVMPHRSRKWLVTPEDYETLKEVVQDDVRMGELLQVVEWSESDANSLMDRFEIEREQAVILAIAQRSHVFCTHDLELRRLAKVLGLEVVDRDEFLDRFARGKTVNEDEVV